jgi:hypothetical protein
MAYNKVKRFTGYDERRKLFIFALTDRRTEPSDLTERALGRVHHEIGETVQ